MKNYSDLMRRLNMYSAEHQFHGGISAEAADALQQLQREREALLAIIDGDCEHCARQNECEWYNTFSFSPEDCGWEWDEDY